MIAAVSAPVVCMLALLGLVKRSGMTVSMRERKKLFGWVKEVSLLLASNIFY